MLPSHLSIGIYLQPQTGERILSGWALGLTLHGCSSVFICSQLSEEINGLLPTVWQGCAFQSEKYWIDLFVFSKLIQCHFSF